jgi:hypothetical protein
VSFWLASFWWNQAHVRSGQLASQLWQNPLILTSHICAPKAHHLHHPVSTQTDNCK